MKVLVIHGPNLNLLGAREKKIYGKITLSAINTDLAVLAKKHKIAIEFYQSNIEGEIVTEIQKAQKKFDYIILNPGAYTHYSIAIRDAISGVKARVIEVHLSNIHAREKFRRESIIAPVCIGQIAGFGRDSYRLALEYILAR
ncbi:MAG: type II 3-dehydroquinate dehydratase [Candidatus Margulisbacteria bacterium]|jgi:3-dehydroquinate dehydratase-2|nr:type II 3-dehydroquinate dehydratase [Candidatus Margulisiibacteriota bacterium]